MGTTSTALFADDIACCVRNDYVDNLRMGLSNSAATREVLAAYADEVSDREESVIVWCALAITQWKYGRLQKRVQKKALQLIKQGGDLSRWQEEGNARLVASRKKVLEAVRKTLESPPPPEKRVRPLSLPPEPPRRATIEHHWKQEQIVAYRRDCGDWVLFLTEGTRDNKYDGQIPYFTVLNWKGKKLPTPERIAKLPTTLTVIAPSENEQGKAIPWERLKRLDVSRRRTGLILVQDYGNDEYGVGGVHSCVSWNEIEAAIDEAFDPEEQDDLKQFLDR